MRNTLFVCLTLLSCLQVNAQFVLPDEFKSIPTCATTHLYSIGDLHYYATVDCANPFTTGYGSSSELLGTIGCDGANCREGATIDPVVFTSFLGKSGISGELLEALLQAKGCASQGRFTVPNGKRRGQRKLVENRLKRIKNSTDDPRKAVATKLLDNMGGKSPFESAGEALDSNDAVEQRKGRFFFDRLADYMSRGRVSASASEQLAMEDKNFGIGILENKDQIGVVRPITGGSDPLFDAHEADWSPEDAKCFEQNSATARAYIEIKVGNDSFFFRLQTVTKTDTSGTVLVTHNIGQQIVEEDLPVGVDTFVSFKNTNIKVVQSENHVHVVRVRNNSMGGLNMNSTLYLLYSEQPIGRAL